MKKNNKVISFPVRSIWSVVVVVVLIAFMWLEASLYDFSNLSDVIFSKMENVSMSDFNLMWVSIIGYVLVGSVLCFSVRIFKELNSYKEEGLIRSLVWGLIAGFSLGFFAALWVCFASMSINSIVGGFVRGITIGNSFALFLAIILGFIYEFNKTNHKDTPK